MHLVYRKKSTKRWSRFNGRRTLGTSKMQKSPRYANHCATATMLRIECSMFFLGQVCDRRTKKNLAVFVSLRNENYKTKRGKCVIKSHLSFFFNFFLIFVTNRNYFCWLPDWYWTGVGTSLGFESHWARKNWEIACNAVNPCKNGRRK